MNDATTDFVTEFPISLGPPFANRPTEQEIIEMAIAKNIDFIIPDIISESVTTWLRSL
tara:strand:+ start:800 stop:973 length:174 start_codon:yes stop_codon:yes gene_type:complete